ncbi:hypothetical protein [Dechloromonas denitrificans]|uniref:hypothetical protein n=1 Tax=Dechloromonas denitrificans TaxID=281362 RepID=UPI0014707115|nr:hypothetical protein [Dechloromonas denitrificans]
MLSHCQSLVKELDQLKDMLHAVDQTLGLHDIEIDPNEISPIRSHDVRITLPHGELTRSILLCLRLNKGSAVSTSVIAEFIAARHADLAAEPESIEKLRQSIRYRLKGLKRSGLVSPKHNSRPNSDGWWEISEIQL